MNFEFTTATKIVFGPGSLGKIGSYTKDLGKKALITSNAPQAVEKKLLDTLLEAGIQGYPYLVKGEPDIETLRQGIEIGLQNQVDLVIGIGGGSALDMGKAIAILSNNQGDIFDYLEVVGRGLPLKQRGLPFVALPTTAGTGSEVTANSVLTVEGQTSGSGAVKVSLRSPYMLARVAIVDPELTYLLPPEVTANTGLDALTQVVEPYVSNKANPMTDAICREGMQRAARSLFNAYSSGDNPTAREDMSITSLFGGMALANAKLGAVHGFAGVLGGRYAAPHGAICARLLPIVMDVNVRALEARQPENPVRARFREVAQILTGQNAATEKDGVAWIEELVNKVHIRPLSFYGLARQDFTEIAEQSARASSMQGNPIKLDQEELVEVLERAM